MEPAGQQDAEFVGQQLHAALAPYVAACNEQVSQITANQTHTAAAIQACIDGPCNANETQF